jgi:hypothetical protein
MSDIIQKLVLKPEATDQDYKTICEIAEDNLVFKGCGSPDDKWIMVRYSRDEDGRTKYHKFIDSFTLDLFNTVGQVIFVS